MHRFVYVSLGLMLFSFALLASSVQPVQLRCEYRRNPLGVDVTRPRFSWVLVPVNTGLRGTKQTAYRVLVASTEANLRSGKGDLWNSGKVDSDQSNQVVYSGRELHSGERAFWRVQVWDESGAVSNWSEIGQWSMGLLHPDDWKAKWIGRDESHLQRDPESPYWDLKNAHWIWSADAGLQVFHAQLTIPANRKIVSARCVMSADSAFVFLLNGVELGRNEWVELPGIFEITHRLHAGGNEITVQATGDQRGRPSGLIGSFRVEFVSGDPVMLVTGNSWRSGDAAVKDLGPSGIAPWGDIGFREDRRLPARMLRKEFAVEKTVKRATVYVAGLGLFELYMNGHKVGDQVLAPGLTDYDKRVQYMTFDVTNSLAQGRNALGLILGNGRYWAPRANAPVPTRSFGYPKALLQMEIEYEDGSTARVVTDDTWQLSTNGPIRANNEYDGEEYDARMAMTGWDRAGFHDADWEAARLVEAPIGKLVAQMAEPIRVTGTLHPRKMTQVFPGVYVFDMGQNMVGWCRLHVSGPKGSRIELRHAETLRSDGTLYVENLRSARATDIYTLNGGRAEVYEPRFTYHGFRYVELRGFPGRPTLATIEGRVVNDDMMPIADFTSSNTLLNQIHHNILWGVRGNYRSIPTDCPQRDERQGWLGDRSQVSRSESFLFDVAAFYSKWAIDLADAQKPSGSIPDVVPTYWSMYHDDVTWPSTLLFVPGMLYDAYGDRRVIERDYPAMKKWIDHMRGYLQDGIMPRDTYGDWCVPPESPKLIHSQDPARKTDGVLIGTAYYYKLLRLMSRYAKLLGKDPDASDYDALAAQVRAAFQKKFFDPQTGFYSNGTQTSSILPLFFKITPEENRATVFDSLIRKIETESHGHVGTGLVGAQWLMRSLSDNGRPDVAYQIATQTTYPGWGYMISKGATTIWELWNGDTADPAMNSGNHVMQIGDLGVWMYEYLAGIRPDPEQPGFKHVAIHPVPTGDLKFVKASHTSMYGKIVSHWRREKGRFFLDVTIPSNTTATVYVPAKDAPAVLESGMPAAKSKGVRFERMENGAAVFSVDSGTYAFQSTT